MEKAIVMEEKDNVATALSDLEASETVSVSVGSERLEVKLINTIPFGHKFAIRRIEKGEAVIKYGESIGHAVSAVNAGQHVHTHNVEGKRGRGTLK